MGLLDSLNEIFGNKQIDETGYQELVKQREKVKKGLATELKKQLMMNDEEIKAVISLIEDYEKELDDVKNKFDTQNHSAKQAEDMYEKLNAIQQKMVADVRGIIRFIMKEKLKKANLLFGNRKNNI